jgi:hypothetical protein
MQSNQATSPRLLFLALLSNLWGGGNGGGGGGECGGGECGGGDDGQVMMAIVLLAQ